MGHAEADGCAGAQVEFQAVLKSAGVRLTQQRKRFWEWAAGQKRGFTIPQALDAMRGYGIGQATVYRNTATLERLGLLRRIGNGNRSDRVYCCSKPGHHHSIVCDRCGLVREFDTCGWALLRELLSLQTGFEIQDHYMEVRGICPECQAAKR